MKRILKRFSVIGYLLFVIGLLIPSSASADVHVYGEGTYSEDELNVSIYADITAPTELRSTGVKLTYDPAEMIVAGAEKNDSVWFIDNEPYMAPDTDTPGQVVVLTFKLDTLNTSQGVNGDSVLLGQVTFIPPAQGTIPLTPTLNLDYGRRGSQNQYANFVDTNLGVLDDTAAVTFGPITITQPGDPEITVHVSTDTGTDLEGVPVYGFTEAGAYFGISATTDESGIAHFIKADYSDGTYKFRADYLSYQFRSDVMTVSEGGPNAVDIDTGGGTLSVNVPEKGYKVRADYMGLQFWSEEFIWTHETVTVNEARAVVTMTSMGLPVEGVVGGKGFGRLITKQHYVRACKNRDQFLIFKLERFFALAII